MITRCGRTAIKSFTYNLLRCHIFRPVRPIFAFNIKTFVSIQTTVFFAN